MRWLAIPFFLWPQVMRYYLKRILRIRITDIESNWIYFLRIALRKGVIVRRSDDCFEILNPKTNQTAIVRPLSSDILVYIQIFFHSEYQRLERVVLPSKPVIFDWGANVGFFTLYSKLKWRDAFITCVEPDEGNCKQLTKQISVNEFSQVQLIKAGIWTSNEALSITPSDSGMNWGFGLTSNCNGKIKGITFRQLLQNGSQKVDLLKMDIEGAEEKLFLDTDFLNLLRNTVSNLIMETHHPDQQTKIANQLIELGFVVERDRELLFAAKKEVQS